MIGLEDSIKRTKRFIDKETIVLDVTSVKVKPLALIKRHFKGYQILGTHPVFGPQSSKNGIEGLPVVLCNVSCKPKTYIAIKSFLKKKLLVQVIEQTAKQHDHEMAHVQGLAHFIGRALKHIDIKDYVTATQSYRQLLELRDLLQNDSWELFQTIQNENPEAKKVRRSLLKELSDLNKHLEK